MANTVKVYKSVWGLVSTMTTEGWLVKREVNKKGETTRYPLLGTCTNCKKWGVERLKQSPGLARKWAKTVVVAEKDGQKVGKCWRCGTKYFPNGPKVQENKPTTIHAQSTPLCKKCGTNPIPKGRRANCYNCVPPKGKAAQKVAVSKPGF